MTKLEELITCCHPVKALKNAGIETVEQLSRSSYEELLTIRGVGPVIVGDLQKRMTEWKNRKDVQQGSKCAVSEK